RCPQRCAFSAEEVHPQVFERDLRTLVEMSCQPACFTQSDFARELYERAGHRVFSDDIHRHERPKRIDVLRGEIHRPLQCVWQQWRFDFDRRHLRAVRTEVDARFQRLWERRSEQIAFWFIRFLAQEADLTLRACLETVRSSWVEYDAFREGDRSIPQ